MEKVVIGGREVPIVKGYQLSENNQERLLRLVKEYNSFYGRHINETTIIDMKECLKQIAHIIKESPELKGTFELKRYNVEELFDINIEEDNTDNSKWEINIKSKKQ